MIVNVIRKHPQHLILLRHLEDVNLRLQGRGYRFTKISTVLYIIVRLNGSLSQILTIDFGDIPRGQVAEPGIEFAGDWGTQWIEFWLWPVGFGGVVSTRDGNCSN